MEVESNDEEPMHPPKCCKSDDTMTPHRLRDIIKDLLRTNTSTAYAESLLFNLRRFFSGEKYLDKVTFMIELSTDGWKQNDKLKFLQWYQKQLKKIVAKRQ